MCFDVDGYIEYVFGYLKDEEEEQKFYNSSDDSSDCEIDQEDDIPF
ncbi:MAG: hypothetical protein ACI3ZR_02675 [bacterium]